MKRSVPYPILGTYHINILLHLYVGNKIYYITYVILYIIIILRYRKNKRQLQKDRPASVHRQQSLGRLQHWYSHKPVVTVDQLHKYRRKEFGTGPDGVVAPPPQPPISLSASPSFDTEYRYLH